MAHDTVSFRIDRKRKAELDALAKAMDRDRSYVINQAVADFVELQKWQVRRIRQGVAAAGAGDYAGDEEIEAARAKWRPAKR